MKRRYFKLADNVGAHPEEPLVEEVLAFMVPALDSDGVPGFERQVHRLRPVEKGGRTVATNNAAVADALSQSWKWVEVDPPISARPRRPRERQRT